MDARTLRDGATLQEDLCIIGGGAVGLALAREFGGGSGKSIVILESGGLTPEAQTQRL